MTQAALDAAAAELRRLDLAEVGAAPDDTRYAAYFFGRDHNVLFWRGGYESVAAAAAAVPELRAQYAVAAYLEQRAKDDPERKLVWWCAGCEHCEPDNGLPVSDVPCTDSPSMDGAWAVKADVYDAVVAERDRLRGLNLRLRAEAMEEIRIKNRVADERNRYFQVLQDLGDDLAQGLPLDTAMAAENVALVWDAMAAKVKEALGG